MQSWRRGSERCAVKCSKIQQIHNVFVETVLLGEKLRVATCLTHERSGSDVVEYKVRV